MNIRKLRKLQRWILAEPRRFDMDSWSGSDSAIERLNPPCGTVGCLAGLACHMEGFKLIPGESTLQGNSYIPHKATQILGLDEQQAERLFYLEDLNRDALSWPERFGQAYANAATALARAKVAVRRIDHFIKTKGAE